MISTDNPQHLDSLGRECIRQADYHSGRNPALAAWWEGILAHARAARRERGRLIVSWSSSKDHLTIKACEQGAQPHNLKP